MANAFHNQLGSVSDQETFFEKTGEFLTKGLVGSAISAGTSFYNTGVALGNVMGADWEEVGTEEALSDYVGDSYADYYRDNQELVDTVGLVAGSFLPGMGAVKAARMAANGLLATKTSRLATAIREVMIPEARVLAAKNTAVAKNFQGVMQQEKHKLLAQGFASNFIEAGIYETATLLTMNQSSAMSREDVGYFEAIGQNLGTAAFGLAFGGVIGGALGGFTDIGRFKAFVQDSQRSKEMVEASRGFKSGTNALLGDEVGLQIHDYQDKAGRLKSIESGEVTGPLVEAEANNLRNTLKAMETDLTASINRNSVGNTYGTFIVDQLKKLTDNGMQDTRMSEFLAGTSIIRPVKVEARKVSDLQPNVLREQAVDGLDPELAPEFTKKYIDFSLSHDAGMAQVNKNFQDWNTSGKDYYDDLLEAAGFMHADEIAALMKDSRVRVNRRDPSGQVIKGADGKKVKSSIKLRGEIESFLDEFAPEYKQSLRDYDEAAAQLRKSGIEDPDVAARVGMLEGRVFELAHPKRMFGAAYRILNQAELSPELKKQIVGNGKFAPLYQWMANNKALRRQYGTVEAVVDSRTMKAVNREVAAGIVDIGPLTVKGKVVESGRKAYPVGVDSYKVGSDVSTVEASAHFAWALTTGGGRNTLIGPNGAIREKMIEKLDARNLPVMTTLVEHYDFARGGVLRIRDHKGISQEVRNNEELYQLVNQTKRTMVLEEATKPASESRSLAELEQILDVDQEYLTSVMAGGMNAEAKGSLFRTKDQNFRRDIKTGEETFRPTYFTVEYDKSSFDNAGARSWGAHDMYRRVRAQQELWDNTARAVLGKDSERLPQVRTAANGSATIMDDMTSMESTVSMTGAVSADYLSAASVTQAAGAFVSQVGQKKGAEIASALAADQLAVAANRAANNEMSILLQSTLRSGRYKFLTPMEELASPDAQRVYQALGIDLKKVIDDGFLTAHNIRNADQTILEAGVADDLYAKAGMTLNQPAERITQLQEILTRGAVNPAAAATVESELAAIKREVLQNLEIGMQDWSGAVFKPQYKAIHQIQHSEVSQALKTMVQVNREYLADPMNMIAKAEGAENTIDPEVLYPGRFPTERYKYVAFVKSGSELLDPWTAKGQGMIVAHSEEALQQKIAHMRRSYGKDVEIITKGQHEDYLKAQRRYDHDMAMTDTFVDSYMAKEGKLWNVMPEPQEDAFGEVVASMQNQARNVVRRAVKMAYAQEIATLKQLDAAYNPSGAIGKKDYVSPYQKMIHQILALPNSAEGTWWSNIQETADQAISKQYHAIQGAWTQAKTSDQWEEYQSLMTKLGLPSIYRSQDDWILANASAPKPLLNKMVAQANGIFSNAMLRLDAAQWTVNAMALPIMLVPEIRNLTKSLSKMDPVKAQRLDAAVSAAFDDTGRRTPTNQKVLMQAVKNLWNKQDGYLQEYRDHGIAINMMQELRQTVDDVAFNPKDNKGWKAKLAKAVDVMGRPADWSETFCKFVAADSCRQILDAAGIAKSSPLYWSTIRTFTSNVTGNYIQSQRPGLFQGWAGQAIGLFQTYQFNLIQRFFRHVEDGNQAAKLMLGVQTATFGTQSLPGFQLLNQHVGERANGEKDFYSITHDSFDNPVAESMLYGVASSLTRPLTGGKGIDFASRGDLTPRTPILIPTSFSEIPAVNLVTKTYGMVAGALDNITGGTDAGTTFLNALAANGLNRPIAGAAQLMQGYKTSHQGNMMVTYPEVGWGTAIAKLMGTRDMDESIATSAYYRSLGYRADRMSKMEDIGKDLKTKLRQPEGASGDDIQRVMERYAEAGGRMETFSRWMQNQYTNAGESTINQLRSKLQSQEGRYLQSVMGAKLDDGMQLTVPEE